MLWWAVFFIFYVKMTTLWGDSAKIYFQFMKNVLQCTDQQEINGKVHETQRTIAYEKIGNMPSVSVSVPSLRLQAV